MKDMPAIPYRPHCGQTPFQADSVVFANVFVMKMWYGNNKTYLEFYRGLYHYFHTFLLNLMTRRSTNSNKGIQHKDTFGVFVDKVIVVVINRHMAQQQHKH